VYCDGWIVCPTTIPNDEANCTECPPSRPLRCDCNQAGNFTCADKAKNTRARTCFNGSGKLNVNCVISIEPTCRYINSLPTTSKISFRYPKWPENYPIFSNDRSPIIEDTIFVVSQAKLLNLFHLLPRASEEKFPEGGGNGKNKKTKNCTIKPPSTLSVSCMKIQGGHGFPPPVYLHPCFLLGCLASELLWYHF